MRSGDLLLLRARLWRPAGAEQGGMETGVVFKQSEPANILFVQL